MADGDRESRPLARDRDAVLFVDDDPGVRGVTTLVLERQHFEPLIAADGESAVELLRQHGARVCVAILDLRMPKMDGLEVAQALRRVRPDLPIIVASGATEAEVRARFAAEPFSCYVPKPFGTSDLKLALASVARTHPPRSA